MSRIARECSDTNCFHVMVQGIAKEYIFDTDEMKNTYIYNLNRFKVDDDIKIIAYCVMDNHCHLLLFVPSVEKLGHFMRRVNTMYAQYYNYKNERVGYVFRDRFKSQAIYDTKYVGNCLCYIHNNPLNAGIVHNAEDYKYSSISCYKYHNGIVDFDAAGELFDTEPSNVVAIANECGADAECPEWIEVKENARTVEDRAYEILGEYGMPPKFLKLDEDKFAECVLRLKNAGMTQREMMKVFDLKTTKAISRVLKR